MNVDLGMVYRTLWGALLIALSAALIVTFLSAASFLRPPIYEPSASLSVQERQPGPPGQGLYPTTPEMILTTRSRPVDEEATKRLELDMEPEELSDNLRVEQSVGKKFIVLTYEDTDRREATQIVNTLAKVASERISQTSQAESGEALTASVYEEARVPRAIEDPKPLRNGLLTLVVVWALCAGLTLAMLVVLRR